MSKERVTVTTLAAGQARAYADSVYHYRVLIEWQGMEGYKDKDAAFVPRPQLVRDSVERIVYGLCGPWEESGGSAFGRKLERMEMVEPGVWDVVIRARYDG